MISIITVNFNETPATCSLLDSIRRQGYADVEVIVVDNGSRENPEAEIRARYPEIKFLRSEKNHGFAGGNNLALRLAVGDYLFFVNNDAEIEPGCLEQLLRFFQEQPKAGIASPLIYYGSISDETPLIQYAGMTRVSPLTGRNRVLGERTKDAGQFPSPFPTAYAHGAAMMVPRKILEEVGPMWDGFFLYYEELDWCERIRRAGYEVWVEPRAKVWHKESLTLGKMGTTKTFYLTRNRILFMRRHAAGWQMLAFLSFLIFAILPKNSLVYLWRRNFSNLRAFWQGAFSGLGASATRAHSTHQP